MGKFVDFLKNALTIISLVFTIFAFMALFVYYQDSDDKIFLSYVFIVVHFIVFGIFFTLNNIITSIELLKSYFRVTNILAIIGLILHLINLLVLYFNYELHYILTYILVGGAIFTSATIIRRAIFFKF